MFHNQGPLCLHEWLLVSQEEPFPQILPGDSDSLVLLELTNISWVLGVNQGVNLKSAYDPTPIPEANV